MTSTDFAGYFRENRLARLQRLRLQQTQHIELLQRHGITDSLADSVLRMIDDELDLLEATPAVFGTTIDRRPPMR